MAKTVEVNIAIDQSHRLDATVRLLESAGLRVRRTMKQLWIVTGTADYETLGQLRKVEGVVSVDPQRPVRAQASRRRTPAKG